MDLSRFVSLFIFGIVLVGGFSACEKAGEAPLEGIVLVISDGTSQELITAARFYDRGADGRLALEDFSRSAIVRTHSASHLVTDSSSAATAMARGIKADNRMVGIASPGDEAPVASILDLAKEAGWTTAVVTDDSVTGGTPSPFMIEHTNRDEHDVIAGKLLDRLGSRVDIVVGGGSMWFHDLPGAKYKEEQQGNARRNGEKLKSLPVAAFGDLESFREHAAGGGDDRAVLATLFPDALPYYADGKRELRLQHLVEETVGLLRAKKKPFLLVVEAALPDKASHANYAKRAIIEVLELDATLAWLRQNLGPNTLILVTTDHNTGGFAFNGYPPLRFKGDVLLRENPASGQSMITWASGPGGGVDGNPVNPATTRSVQENGESVEIVEPLDPTAPTYRQPAALGVKSAYHTGGDVWLLADGPGSDAVRGYLDNTDIFRIMRRAIRGEAR